MNEADTCRTYVVPRLQAAGWDRPPHSITEQRSFTDGRIVVAGSKTARRRQKRADYLLRYTRDVPMAVVEAKADYKAPGEGLGQAKDYAEVLGLKFAYSTNGQGIVEFDFLAGTETNLDTFPAPFELWQRIRTAEGITTDQEQKLLTPGYYSPGRQLRYYQELAVNRAVQAVLQRKRRLLLTMATGTGKTETAFQICWRLWSGRWNRDGRPGRPRILYLADRNILIDDPKDKTFAAFGDARAKIEGGNAVKSREMYFAIYQALAGAEGRPPLYRQYPRDFFDLVIVDECHRGSARDDSSWREILEYFEPAYQLGMTATPLREESRDTYRYFGGAPLYTYSLRDGIEDGFLAPYRVHRAFTPWDAAGWRPSRGELDRYGREIPDEEYQTKDFERAVALRARTEAVARHLTGHLKKTDRFAKTIVFCVDQEHALEMRQALVNLNADLVKDHPDYVCRVTADEKEVGRGHLSNFQDVERRTPVILTTSQLLTTGVDAPTVRNIVLVRVINSMTEFKQIIGRGTRVRDDYGKLYFTILDYTGSATRLFADPEFDGDPARVTTEEIDDEGEAVPGSGEEEVPEEPIDEGGDEGGIIIDEDDQPRRKFYFDGDYVEVVGEVVYDLDADGKKLAVVKLTDYAGEKVRTLFPLAAELRQRWSNPGQRSEIIDMLIERGIDFDTLAASANQPDADPFDLLCHLAYNAPLRTRRERAEMLRHDRADFFDQYGPDARAILSELLEKYAEHGTAQFVIPDVLKVPPISERGNVIEIARLFGGGEALRLAVHQLQTLLYES